jgi:putative DNA primase/helicase
VAEATETPAELAAMLGLGVVALSIAGKVEVAPTENPDHHETTNLYCCAAMESGNRKSTVLNYLTEPVIDWEAEQEAKFQDHDSLRSKRKTIEQQIDNMRRRKCAKDEPIEALQQKIAALEAKLPEIPIVPQLWSQDITPEHLGTNLAEQNGRLALLSAEGGLFENFAGRYSRQNTPNIDLLLQAYDGSPAKVERAHRVIHLRHPTLTVAIVPQPDVLRGMTKHPEFRARGLMGRFMYVIPPSPVGERTGNTVPIPQSVRHAYHAGITQLLNMPVSRSTFGRIEPQVLRFSKAAQQIWKEFASYVEHEMRDGNPLSECKDWGGKLPGKTARLAAIMYAVSCPWNDRPAEIQPEHVRAAVTLATLFISHALAAFGLMSIDPTIDHALKIVKWLKTEQKEIFSVREAFCRFQRVFTRLCNMQPCLSLLVEHGYIRALGKPEGKKTELFQVCPRVRGYQD